MLLRDFPEIQIVIAGTGQKESEIRELATSLNATNVKFLGARPYVEMPQINALADVLLVHLIDLPFFGSTIPSKTQVSLASARPILMAVRGDAADSINAAQAGISCPPQDERAMADAILELYRKTPEERDAMGERGRQFYLREMSLDVGGSRMEEIFARVLRDR